MRSIGRRTLAIAAAVAAIATVVVAQDAAAQWDANQLGGAVTSQHYECGARDLPEGDIQGHVPKADQDSRRAEKGYNCGLALVSHATLGFDGRPPDSGGQQLAGNANMAWAGNCAYVASSGGVAVAPETKPSPPKGAGVAVVSVDRTGRATHVGNLRQPGALVAAETINAVTTPDGRSILVVGQYGNDAVSDPKPMDVYDVSNPDCRKWKHIPNVDHPGDATLATYYWPANIHNLTISQDGRYVFATIPTQAVDISGLWDRDPRTTIRYLGNIDDALPTPPVAPGPLADVDDGVPYPVIPKRTQALSHEAWPSADGRTLYLGGQQATGELFDIVDLTDWLRRDAQGRPAGPPHLISQRAGRGHSIRTARIGGHPYLVHSEESPFGTGFSCIPETANPFAGPSQPWLTDITDPRNPKLVSQMGLEINDPSHCPDQVQADEDNSVHYQDVDDPNDTTFVMASMWNSGLRVFDVRNPHQPTEVAYFNPGDIDPTASTRLDHAWAHIRYLADRGQIWFTTADGGFWVLRIEGKVRRYLDLDRKNRLHGRPELHVPTSDPGLPGTAGVRLPATAVYVDATPFFCTLATPLAG